MYKKRTILESPILLKMDSPGAGAVEEQEVLLYTREEQI